jgi:hypothetical protein
MLALDVLLGTIAGAEIGCVAHWLAGYTGLIVAAAVVLLCTALAPIVVFLRGRIKRRGDRDMWRPVNLVR